MTVFEQRVVAEPDRSVYTANCLCGWSSPPMTTQAAAVPVGDRHVEQPDRRPLPPVTCRPWCEYGDGHANEVWREDQYCSREVNSVPLTLHPLQPCNLYDEAAKRWVTGPDKITLWLHQGPDDEQPRLRLTREVTVPEVRCEEWSLTTAEADLLILALADTVRQAQQ